MSASHVFAHEELGDHWNTPETSFEIAARKVRGPANVCAAILAKLKPPVP